MRSWISRSGNKLRICSGSLDLWEPSSHWRESTWITAHQKLQFWLRDGQSVGVRWRRDVNFVDKLRGIKESNPFAWNCNWKFPLREPFFEQRADVHMMTSDVRLLKISYCYCSTTSTVCPFVVSRNLAPIRLYVFHAVFICSYACKIRVRRWKGEGIIPNMTYTCMVWMYKYWRQHEPIRKHVHFRHYYR